jgi:cytochrome c
LRANNAEARGQWWRFAAAGARFRSRSLAMALPRRLLILCLAATLFSRAGRAADQATPEEAKALAERAAAHFKEAGPEKAIADFNSATGGYVDRELFVVVYDPANKIVGSYGVPVLNGKDATTLKDVEGREFGKDIIALAKTQGSGWVEYRMTNPVTKKVALKRSWVIGLGDYILFVGAFGS